MAIDRSNEAFNDELVEGMDLQDPGVQAYLAELAVMADEDEREEIVRRVVEYIQEIQALEAVLGCNGAWQAGMRVRYIERRNGSVVELLIIGKGSTLRAMPVKDGEPQTSRHRHPNRGRGGPHDFPVHPDSLAVELLSHRPDDEQTGASLLQEARQNQAAYMRYRELQQALGAVVLPEAEVDA